MRVLVAGGGAREHAIAAALATAEAKLVVVAPNVNPGLAALAETYERLDPTDPPPVVACAQRCRVDYAVIGPEAPLAAGLADALRIAGIPVVGPDRNGARIESSKRFCRELLDSHQVPGAPRHLLATTPEEVDARVQEIGGAFVIKPVGLTSGKGVAVQGSDFPGPAEGAAWAKEILATPAGKSGVLIEEKLEGEEFSLMAFVTDSGVYPMPLVQDFKRAGTGDSGPNTGGMGAYTQRDHLLPFVSRADRDAALDVLTKTVAALKDVGIAYRGILYGGFMETAAGPKLLEFNARFGDPESINVLSLYEPGDFDALLHGVATGHVDPSLVQFRLRASVSRYLVPNGYPNAAGGAEVDVDDVAITELGVRIRYGAVDAVRPGRVRFGTSRGLALVGEASAIHEAGTRVDAALAFVRGPFDVRRDIGTKEDLAKRTEHVRMLKVPGAKSSPLPLSVAAPDAPPSSSAPSEMLLSSS